MRCQRCSAGYFLSDLTFGESENRLTAELQRPPCCLDKRLESQKAGGEFGNNKGISPYFIT